MLAESSFDFDRPLTGMEIECNLVDADYQPAMSNQQVLAAIADPAYQTELGAYNIEFNVPPRPLPGRTALELESEIRASLNAAETKASADGSHIVMIGILPTLMPEDLTGSWMSPSMRYQALNDSIFTARGEDITIDIAGADRLSMHAESIAPESACTSMQLHLQVSPADFANNWNAAQVLAGPQLALGANSPYFLGHELWAETRIELFAQATDPRPEELKAQGVICSKNRIARRMKALNLQAQNKKRFKPSSKQDKALADRIADNVLNRDFTATAVNQKYVADITYIPTTEGWLYLAVVIDVFSRAVIGWSMQSTMTQQLVIDALFMALQKRNYPQEILFHSDRGSQYCAHDFQNILNLYNCTISMSRKGNCWDNSIAESFFHTLKVELVHHERYTSLEEAKSSIFKYIETYYNRLRRHSSIGYLAPFAFEQQALLVA
jgi:transposase InsO family protein